MTWRAEYIQRGFRLGIFRWAPRAPRFLGWGFDRRLESSPPLRYDPRLSPIRTERSEALEFCALASGSKGNAVYLGCGGRGVLVDVGLSGREVEGRLQAAGLDPAGVAAVVVTHAHRDHLWGVGPWARRHGVPVFLTEACYQESVRALGSSVDVRVVEPGCPFEAGGLEFTAFSTSHDAGGSVGFRVSDGCAVAGLATDLGFACPEVRGGLQAVGLLYLESNHDETLLKNGPYPRHLKQRIRSDLGHLSNRAAAELVGDLLHPGLKALVLGHLSEVNNEPRFAFGAGRDALAAAGAAEDVTLLVARQDRPGRVLRVL